MKKILTNIFAVLIAFVCCTFNTLNTSALEETAYKTVTNRDIIYIIEKNDVFDYSWRFEKDKYRDGIDFSLNVSSHSPYQTMIDKKISTDIKRKYLSFEHHGNLPSTALMKVNVDGHFNDGEELYLYYYNDKTGELEYVDDNIVVKNNFVEFEIEHCSDYILTASIVKSAVDNPQGMTIIIIFLIALGVALVAATLFMNNKK